MGKRQKADDSIDFPAPMCIQEELTKFNVLFMKREYLKFRRVSSLVSKTSLRQRFKDRSD